MPKTINRFGLFATSVILVSSLVLLVLHELVLAWYVSQGTVTNIPRHAIYLFLVPLTLIGFWFVYLKYKKDHTAAGRTYFIVVFVKIFASIFFLYPDVIVPATFMREMVIQFMPAFFVLLFIETFLLVKLLNQPLSEKLKNDENQ